MKLEFIKENDKIVDEEIKNLNIKIIFNLKQKNKQYLIFLRE